MKEKEHQSVEWKQAWRDEYLKWICGYANAYGGTIYIGTDDNGNVVGIDNARELLERIPNKITDTMGIIADVNCNRSIVRTLSSLYFCATIVSTTKQSV